MFTTIKQYSVIALAVVALSGGIFATYSGALYSTDSAHPVYAASMTTQFTVNIDGGGGGGGGNYVAPDPTPTPAYPPVIIPPIYVPPTGAAPICTLDLTKDTISWTTGNATQVLISPLTNSPQIPGLVAGAPQFVNHTETQAYQSAAVIADMQTNGGINLPSVQWNTGFYPDQPTMDRVCTLIEGTNSVASNIGIGKYSSPGNNAVVQYTGSGWTQIVGYHKFHLSASFTCSHGSTLSSYPFNGSYNFVPPLGVGTHTYQLTANGPGGTKTCTATVVVVAPPPPPPTPTPICTLDLTKDSISWTTGNATQVLISPLTNSPQIPGLVSGSSSVTNHSEADAYNSQAVIAEMQTNGINLPAVQGNTGFSPDQTTMNHVCILLHGAGSVASNIGARNYTSPGNNAVVSYNGYGWTLTGGVKTHLSTSFTCSGPAGLSTYPLNGSYNFVPPLGVGTHTYHLVANGPGGTHSCDATVVVPPPTANAPTCTLNVTPNSCSASANVALAWTTTNSTSFVIDHGVGSVTPVAAGSKNINPTYTTTYTGTATGAGGTVTCSTTVTVNTPPPPKPACTLKVVKGICNVSEQTQLEWTTINATNITIDHGIGSVTPVASGSKNISATATTVYTATVTGPGGSATCDTTITILPPPPPQVPSCALAANDTNITAGDSVVLSWAASNVTAGTIDNGVGAVTPVSSGSKTVAPTVTTNYVATFTGPHGSTQCSVKVKVTPKYDAPTCTLYGSPTQINQGQSSTLSWTSTNATAITIDSGVGSVTPVAAGSKTVTPASTTYYTATATGPGGSVQCMTKIKVVPVATAPSCTLSVNPTTINAGGTATVSWTTANVTGAVIDHAVGSVSINGTTSVTATTTTTYTGTFTGPGGTVTCAGTLNVTPPPAPACTVSVSASNITPGQSVIVSWTSINATTGSITGIGNATPVSSGSTELFPSTNTTYTGTFTGPNGTVQCSSAVTVAMGPGGCTGNCGGGGFNQPNVVLLQKPAEAPLAYVSLAQIPYTGFAAGKSLTLAFWIAVGLLAAIATYFIMGAGGLRLVLGGALANATGVDYTRKSDDDEYEMSPRTSVHQDSAAYVASVAAPVMAMPVTRPAAPATDGIPEISDVIESRAHGAGVLMSPEAVAMTLELSKDRGEVLQQFGEILNKAVKTLPSEDGWIMMTSERFAELADATPKVVPMATADVTPSVESILASVMQAPAVVAQPTAVEMPMSAPADQGEVMKLAEALLAGNRDVAYAMARALETSGANATSVMTVIASSLDQLYRARRHGTTTTLTTAAASVTDEALAKMVETFAHSMDAGYANAFTSLKLAMAQAFEARG